MGISNEEFNKFLSDNKEKIDRITPKNPPLDAEDLEDIESTKDSLRVSLEEVRKMQDGLYPKKTWDEYVADKNMPLLKRDAMSKLHEWYNKGGSNNVLWVRGLKNTGKTTLVKHFISGVFDSPEGIYMISMLDSKISKSFKNFRESVGLWFKLEDFMRYLVPEFDEEKTKLIVFDDVQEDYRAILDASWGTKCRCILCGDMTNKVTDHDVVVTPLSFKEFRENSDVDYVNASEEDKKFLLMEYCTMGGFPAVVRCYFNYCMHGEPSREIRAITLDWVSMLTKRFKYNNIRIDAMKALLVVLKIAMKQEDLGDMAGLSDRLFTALSSAGYSATRGKANKLLAELKSEGIIYIKKGRIYFCDLGVITYLAVRLSDLDSKKFSSYIRENFNFLQKMYEIV